LIVATACHWTPTIVVSECEPAGSLASGRTSVSSTARYVTSAVRGRYRSPHPATAAKLVPMVPGGLARRRPRPRPRHTPPPQRRIARAAWRGERPSTFRLSVRADRDRVRLAAGVPAGEEEETGGRGCLSGSGADSERTLSGPSRDNNVTTKPDQSPRRAIDVGNTSAGESTNRHASVNGEMDSLALLILPFRRLVRRYLVNYLALV
jgi:hypothetical protein